MVPIRKLSLVFVAFAQTFKMQPMNQCHGSELYRPVQCDGVLIAIV